MQNADVQKGFNFSYQAVCQDPDCKFSGPDRETKQEAREDAKKHQQSFHHVVKVLETQSTN